MEEIILENDFFIKPQPYIQNRTQWCWAVACRIVGEQYKKRHPKWKFSILKENESEDKVGEISSEEYEKGIFTKDEKGIRVEAVGKKEGYFTIDGWQRAIVANANTGVGIGYEGDIAGDDEAKERGIKYVITGDIFCKEIEIENLGYYHEEESIFHQYKEEIMKVLKRKEYILVNVVLEEKQIYHTMVLLEIKRKEAYLYDPWNGMIIEEKIEDIFEKGFYIELGKGIVKWIQFVEEKKYDFRESDIRKILKK